MAEIVRRISRAVSSFLAREWGIIVLCLFVAGFYAFTAGYGDIYWDNSVNLFRSLGWLDYFTGQEGPLGWYRRAAWWTAISFQDAPPLVFIFQHLSLLLFGESAIAARLPFIAAAIGTGIAVYALVAAEVDKRTALVAAALTLFGTYALRTALAGYLEGVEVLFVMLAFAFLVRHLSRGSAASLYAAFACLGLALLSKYTAMFLIPVFVYALAYRDAVRDRLVPPTWESFYIFFLVAVTAAILTPLPPLLFVALEAIALLSWRQTHDRAYLFIALLGWLPVAISSSAGVAVLMVGLAFKSLSPFPLRVLLAAMRARWQLYAYGSAIVLGIMSPVIVYNIHSLALGGVVDLQIASLVGLPNVLHRTPSFDIAANGLGILTTLIASGSLPYTVGSLAAALWIIVKAVAGRATVLERTLALCLMFMFAMFSFTGGALRFLSLFVPFLSMALALAIAALYRYRFMRGMGTAIVAAVFAFELFFAWNTIAAAQPIGRPGLTYAPALRIESFGYNELDAVMRQLLGEPPRRETPTRYEDLMAVVEPALPESWPNTVIVYDDRFNWFPSWWYIERYRLYYRQPLYPANSEPGTYILSRFMAGEAPIPSGVRVYYLHTATERTRWDAVEPDIANDAVAGAAEDRGAPATLVRSRAGEHAFTLYCLQGCEDDSRP